MLLGSEGILGVITQAWVRLQDRPSHKASAGVTYPDFAAGAEAVRAIAQSALYPTNCRLLDAVEAETTGASTEGALMVLGFESADHPVEHWMERALELARDHGGEVTRRSDGKDSVGAWRDTFLRAPYLRDTFVALRTDLEAHLAAEEELLFPLVRSDGPYDAAQLDELEHDHEWAGTALARMRGLTDGYDLDGALCNTHRAALDGLRELELDLHQHIHEENNVLFPRLLAAA